MQQVSRTLDAAWCVARWLGAKTGEDRSLTKDNVALIASHLTAPELPVVPTLQRP